MGLIQVAAILALLATATIAIVALIVAIAAYSGAAEAHRRLDDAARRWAER